MEEKMGSTLSGICSFIKNKYSIDISNQRKNLIKKRIIALRESQDLVNVTGKGFRGHLKLVDKARFIRNMNTPKKRPPRLKKPVNQVQLVEPPLPPSQNYELLPSQQNELEEPMIPSQQYEPVLSSDVSVMPSHIRRNINHQFGFDSPFATPMVPNRASTPIPQDYDLPFAPQRFRRRNQTIESTPAAEGTPRISSITRKRRLLRTFQDE